MTGSLIREADENGDRRVSRDEARRFLEIQLGMRRNDGKLLRDPNGRVCNLMLYRHIDLNKNDRLERDEFEQRSFLKEKAADVFESGDVNGDESLSFDEWCGLPNRSFIMFRSLSLALPVCALRQIRDRDRGLTGPA